MMDEERLARANTLQRNIKEYEDFRNELLNKNYFGVKTITKEKFLFYRTAFNTYDLKLNEDMKRHLISAINKEIEKLKREFSKV